MFERVSSLLNEYKKKIKNRSFRNMIYITFTFTAVLELGLFALFYFGRYGALYETMTKRQQDMKLESAVYSLNKYIGYLNRDIDSIYKDILKDTYTSRSEKQLLLNYAFQSNKEFVSDISVFDKEGNLKMVSPSSTLKKNVNIKDEEWFKAAIAEKSKVCFSEPTMENLFAGTPWDYNMVIPVSRYVKIENGTDSYEGIILINFKHTAVSELCDSLTSSIYDYTYLINSDGEIICHPYIERVMIGVKPENNFELANLKDGQYARTFLGSTNIYAIKSVEGMGWRFVSVCPLRWMGINGVREIMFLLFMISVFAILIILINDYFSRKVSDPIGELEHSVRLIAAGELDTRVRISGSAEVKSLAMSVSRMAAKIKKLMADVVREQELKRKSEMDSLQAQINPHFLYNTLDIITWMIERDKKEEATEIVTALARLFRISISKGKNVITVQDEIEHIRNYLVIQSRRYKNQFSYSIELDEAAQNLATIKLIVQPMVENAIYHAMEFMEDDGELYIHAYREKDDLYISIRDNGMGMTESQVENLLKKPVESKRGNGIGVYNVNERIKLYFGMEYGVIIHSELDEGTEIILHMPAINYEDFEGNKT